jgi:magnesium-transporting ATPase (P-type)
MINLKQNRHNSIVKEIYTGGQHYQVNGQDYSPEGCILEVSPQESKCWALDITKLYSHIALRECLIASILCNNSYLKNKEEQWLVIGNPSEGASIAAASKAKLDRSSFEQLMPKLDTIPFKSKFQYMATLHSNIEGKIIYIKGNPKTILPRARQMLDTNGNLINLDLELISLETESMLEAGLQIVAFAKKQILTEKTAIDRAELESEFVFLGLQGVEQPNSASKHIQTYMHLMKSTLFGEHILQANYEQKTVDSFDHQIPLTENWNENKWQVADEQLKLNWNYLLVLVTIALLLIVFLGSIFYFLYFLLAKNFVFITLIVTIFLFIILSLFGSAPKNLNEQKNLADNYVNNKRFRQSSQR